jgi:predicted hotdog family 3-hydroxylacyl-ACP dehydratase
VLIDKPGIARLIPHAGEMCLLDSVLSWDEVRIQCATESHRAPYNPLRRNHRLGTLCGVEYAAQAMALHNVLTVSGAHTPGSVLPRPGYLASLRELVCHGDRLDLLPGTLVVVAERLFGEASRAIYHFTVRHQDSVLLDGRAAVVVKEIG